MKHYRLTYIFVRFSILLLIAMPILSRAGNEPEIKDWINGYDLVNNSDSTKVIFDNQSYDGTGNYDTSYSSLGYREYSIENRIYLELNEYLDDCFLDTFSLGVKVAIQNKGLGGTSIYDTVWLHINYDTALLTKNREISSYIMQGGLWTEIKVLEVDNPQYLEYFKVGVTLNIERYRNISFSSIIGFNTIQKVGATEEAKFSWDVIDGAEEYDLEWTWVDAILEDNTLASASLTEVDFRHNATRITVTDAFYSIPVAYERGYLVARVRPVGRNKDKPEQVVTGLWSNNTYGTELSNYTSGTDYLTIMPTGTSYEPLDDAMNWQYVSTYAEQGKRKEVVSYYDGSLRNRQSVTRINSDSGTVVGETIYDFEGRPAVNILPVPAFAGSDRYNKLRFVPGFNISKSSNETYNRTDFDIEPAAACGSVDAPLKDIAGASLYYSVNNPMLSERSGGFIPDAEEYPMTMTEYMPDGTGRIARQGGVGADHQLGSGHETFYYYATPEQQELDRLFGNAVGYHEHYQKEMVIDPNGQASVSYKDLSGKVIATGLAGDSPTNVDALTSEASAETSLLSILYSDSAMAYGDIAIEKEIVVATNGSKYELSYGIDIPALTYTELPNMCFDCVYELEISLLNDCGEEILDGNSSLSGNQSIVRTLGKPSSDFDTDCETGGLTWDFSQDADINDTAIILYLDRGKYSLKKTLRLSKNAADFYLEEFLASDVAMTQQNFIDLAFAREDTAFCSLTCDECLTSLGTLSNYVDSNLTGFLQKGLDSTTATNSITDKYNSLYQQCKSLCENEITDGCEAIYYTLLYDVIPMGQYAEMTFADDGTMTTEGILDVANSATIGFNYKQYEEGGNWYDIDYKDSLGNTIYVNVNGVDYTPNQLSVEDYIKYYDDEWAHSVVVYHPEYCRYTQCKTDSAAHVYEKEMLAVTSFNQAYREGFLDPLNREAGIPQYTDPLFVPSSENNAFYTNNYSEYGDFTGTAMYGDCKISMLQFAFFTHYADHSQSNCTEMTSWLNSLTIDTTVLCDNRADAVWELFRGIYLSQRSEYIDANTCYPALADGYTRRFIRNSDVADELNVDNTLSLSQLDSLSAVNIASYCDTTCNGYAQYWLNRLGGCGLDQSTQEELISAFVSICKEGCDEENPMGSRNGGSGTYASFEEAFEAIVPEELRSGNPSCDPWLIGMPPVRSISIMNLAGKSDSCAYAEGANDTCFTEANNETKKYLNARKILDADGCKECITCPDMYIALTALEESYDGDFDGFFGDSSDVESRKAEILTNFMNAQFGFNLNYWDYKDFIDSCGTCQSTLTDSVDISAYMMEHFEKTTQSGVLERRYIYQSYDYSAPPLTTYAVTTQDQTDFQTSHNNRTTPISTRHIDLAQIMTPYTMSLTWTTVYDTSTSTYPNTAGISACLTNNQAVNSTVAYNIDTINFFGTDVYDTTHYSCITEYNLGQSIAKPNFTQGFYRKQGALYNFLNTSYDGYNVWIELFYNDSLYVYDSASTAYKLVPSDSLLGHGNYTIDSRILGTHQVSEWIGGDRTIVTVNDGTSHKYSLAVGNWGYQLNYADSIIVKNFQNVISYTKLSNGHYTSQVEVELYNGQIDTIAVTLDWNPFEGQQIEICNRPDSVSYTLCNRALGTSNVIVQDPCITWKSIRAHSFAARAYRQYIDSLRRDFQLKYDLTCKGAKDSIKMDYELKEYHYTLYYYDQAGNLIQTVPPEGVHIISSPTALDSIRDARENEADFIYPEHTLTTLYKYNSLNEVRWQRTPDGGNSQFWYDRLGRMAVSQNAEQAIQSIPNYSYTLYDTLGRISEVGQIRSVTQMTKEIAFDTSMLDPWIESNFKEQITRTWYDYSPLTVYESDFEQKNLRSRVAAMAFFPREDEAYSHAVHYSYDIHGNVFKLAREVAALVDVGQGFKMVEYDYDLVSGNVNYVYYQRGRDDQFTHRYYYDADNRITEVYTSTDLIHWDRDAQYTYNAHGPLQRTIIGNLNVQGIDYAYTLHGWLKGVNSNMLVSQRDMGQDGYGSVTSNVVARDAFGFSLHYYNGDYQPINNDNIDNASNYFMLEESASAGFVNAVPDLYNGNISRMVTALDKISNTTIGKAYSYDQLNRIVSAETFTNYSVSTNGWLTGGSTNNHFSKYSYDANGNILTLQRYAGDAQVMDHLSYNYITGSNQLEYVDDTVGVARFTNDIDDQALGNYTYDKIGNMITDEAEDIIDIQWNVYGKITRITRKGSPMPFDHMERAKYTDLVGVTYNETTGELTRSGGASWSNGANGVQLIPGDGGIEWTRVGPNSNSTNIIVGLAYTDRTDDGTEYRWYSFGSNYRTQAASVNEGTIADMTSNPQGSVFRIERRGNIIYWSVNGEMVGHAVESQPGDTLFVNVNMYGYSVEDLRIFGSMDTSNGISEKPSLSFEYSPDGHRVVKHVTDNAGNTVSTYYVRDASGNILSTYNKYNDTARDVLGLGLIDVYDYVASTKTVSSLLDFLRSELSWTSRVTSSYLDSLKTIVKGLNVEEQVLDNFSATPYLNNSVFAMVYDEEISNSDLIISLRTGGDQDADLVQYMCDSGCVDSMLMAMITYNDAGFLDALFAADQTMFDSIVRALGVVSGNPIQERDDMLSNYTYSQILNEFGTYGHNCSTYWAIFTMIVEPNSQNSANLLASQGDLKNCVLGFKTKSQIASALGSELGTELWDAIFNQFSTSQENYVDSVYLNGLADFLYYALLELDSSELTKQGFESMTDLQVDEMLAAIQSFYGQAYYEEVLAAWGGFNNIWTFIHQEHHIYGSSRLGIRNNYKLLAYQDGTTDTAIVRQYRDRSTFDGLIAFRHVANDQTITQDEPGGVLKVSANGWESSGQSEQAIYGNCKMAMEIQSINLTKNLWMVGLSYSDIATTNSITYRYYPLGSNYRYRNGAAYITTSVPIQTGDQATIERNEGKIYFYIIRSNGARIDIDTVTELYSYKPMRMAYDIYNSGNEVQLYFSKVANVSYVQVQDSTDNWYMYRGEKRYEMSNHLGNVLAVVTDRRIQSCNSGDVMYYEPQVLSVSDYYPFGMLIQERNWSALHGGLDTAHYQLMDITHDDFNGNSTIINDSTIQFLETGWNNGGNARLSTSGDCKVEWIDPNISGTEDQMVGLAYGSYTGAISSIDYKIYADASSYYKYYIGTTLTTTTTTKQSGDRAYVERKGGKIYMYIVRSNGTRVNLVDVNESQLGEAMTASYATYNLNSTLVMKFYHWKEAQSFAYRFGFNGYENEGEVAGQGAVIDFGARIYDSRLGRFFSRDPIVYPYWSPYQYDGNSPISVKDILGMGNPNEEKPKTKYKDANGSTFLANDLKNVKYATKESYSGTYLNSDKKGAETTVNYVIGGVRSFDTEDGTHYNARFKENEDGTTQFIGYFNGENKYKAEYTNGPIIMGTYIQVSTDKETGIVTATMTIFGNEETVWNDKQFTFEVPQKWSIDDYTTLSESVGFFDGVYHGELYLQSTNQDVEKMLQNVVITATTTSASIGKNQASVGVSINTIDAKKNFRTLFYGWKYGATMGVSSPGVPLGPLGGGGASGKSKNDTIKPLTYPNRTDSLRVYGQ